MTAAAVLVVLGGPTSVAPFPRPARPCRPRPPGTPSDHQQLAPGGSPAQPSRTTLAPADRRRPELTDAAVVSRSWGMAFATLVSRITGFTRIVLLAAILGAALSSAFSVANQLPNLVAALVLEATFTAIFVPVLARAERDDADGGAAFVRRLVTLATTLLLVTTVLSVAAAPLLVGLMLGSDPQVDKQLTIAFAYLLLPQVLFYGLSSVFMAILEHPQRVSGHASVGAGGQQHRRDRHPRVVCACSRPSFRWSPAIPSFWFWASARRWGWPRRAWYLLIAIARERISLRPLWGIDDRLKQFGAMAAAMVLYVLISQLGLVIGNPNRQLGSGFRARDLQLHLAGVDVAVRHDRSDDVDRGHAAAVA